MLVLTDFGVHLLALAAAGSFGGFIHGIVHPTDFHFTVPFARNKQIPLGLVGDMLIGVGATLAMFVLASPLIDWDGLKDAKNDGKLMHAIGLAVIAGFSGQALVMALSKKLLGQIAEVEQLEKKITRQVGELKAEMHYSQLGDFYKSQNKWKLAIDYYDLALATDPNDTGILLNKAYCLKRSHPHDLKQALALVDRAISIQPGNERALYNRACYRALISDFTLKEIYSDLELAFESKPFYRELAREDPDLGRLREDPHFNELLGGK